MSDSEEEIDPAVAGSSDDEEGSESPDDEEPEGMTHLEHGFNYFMMLIRSETPWRENGSGEWAPELLDKTLGDVQDKVSDGTFPPDFGVNYTTGNFHYATLLHVAAMEEKLECVRVLLRRGADVTLRDVSGQTPLHMAMYNGSAAAGLLLAAGADVNAQMSPGRSPLVMSAQFGRPHTSHILLRAGAHVTGVTAARFDDPALWDNAMGDTDRVADARALIDAVRAAGSYKAYLRALRTPLVALRRLCASGRAGPGTDCPEVLRRLFPSPVQPAKKRTRSAALVESTMRTELPDEIFLTILQYWSTLQTNAMAVQMGPEDYDEDEGWRRLDEAHEQASGNPESSSDSE